MVAPKITPATMKKEWYDKKGITSEKTAQYASQQNGKAGSQPLHFGARLTSSDGHLRGMGAVS